MENELRKELKVSAIENGTVIDHIPTNSLFLAVKILNLDKAGNMVLFGTNLDSKKFGKKGIIKVSNRYFEQEEINKIALVAPSATLIEIHDFEVTRKASVEIPDEIKKFVKCFNPNCITNHQDIITMFKVISKDELKIQCHYCEKITAESNIVFK